MRRGAVGGRMTGRCGSYFEEPGRDGYEEEMRAHCG